MEALTPSVTLFEYRASREAIFFFVIFRAIPLADGSAQARG